MEIKPKLTSNKALGNIKQPQQMWSVYGLLAANIIPLIGVLFFEWDANVVLALYWIENIIIGVFNVLKMVLASGVQRHVGGIFLSVFFVLHYGLFCSAHGTLLSGLLGFDDKVAKVVFEHQAPGLLSLFQDGLTVFMAFINNLSPEILYGIAALFLSRLVSFIEHFFLAGRVFKTSANQLMAEPYGQIVVMHAGLILGAVALNKLNSPIWLLAIIVLFKIVFDYSQHLSRHKATKAQDQEDENSA